MGSSTLIDVNLIGLPSVTDTLVLRTTANAVVERIVTGPLREWNATAGIIVCGSEQVLTIIGAYGYEPSDLAGFETMPVFADLPICRAYREGEIVVTSTLAAEGEFAGLATQPSRWKNFRSRSPQGSIVSVPLLSQGLAVGCLGLSFGEERRWGSDSMGLLDVLASTLAMWMTHPVSGFDGSHEWAPTGSVALTERQRQVLQHYSHGRSTAQIAVLLRYSESTIKQDERYAARVLDSQDRATTVKRARLLGLLEGLRS